MLADQMATGLSSWSCRRQFFRCCLGRIDRDCSRPSLTDAARCLPPKPEDQKHESEQVVRPDALRSIAACIAPAEERRA